MDSGPAVKFSPLPTTESRAVVEQHKADVVTTIFIPVFNQDVFPNYPKIMYKTDFRDILRPLRVKKKKISPSVVETPGTVDPLDIAGPSVHIHERKRGHGSNFIDLLEKKYCGGNGMLDPDYEDREDSSAWGDSPAPSTSTGASPDQGHVDEVKAKRKRKKGGKESGDYYDTEDGFIDDSENILEIEAQISGKHLKTKHSGFFINAGELDVLKGSDDHKLYENSVTKKKKKKAASNVHTSSNSSVNAAGSKKKGNELGTITPYHMFLKANKASVRNSNPEECKEPGGLQKLMGAMWKSMHDNDKEIYVKSAASAMKSKSKNSAKSNGKAKPVKVKAAKSSTSSSDAVTEGGSSSVSRSGAPLGGLSPYNIFCRLQRESVRAANPELCAEKGGTLKLTGALWKGLADEDKKFYADMATAGNNIVSKLQPKTEMTPEEYFYVTQRPDNLSEDEEAILDRNVKLQAMWSNLSPEDKKTWADIASEKNKVMTDSATPTFSIAGFELFSVVKNLKSAADPSSEFLLPEEIKACWESTANKGMWESAARAIGAHATASKKAKLKKKRPAESKEADDVCSSASKKLDDSEKPKVKKKKAKKADISNAGNAPVDGDVKATSPSAKSPTVKKKRKAHSPLSAGPLWSQPPGPISEALIALQRTVEAEVLVQHESDQKKSKRKLKSDHSIKDGAVTPQSLRKITACLEEQLEAFDALAVSFKMPGTDPLMKAQKNSLKAESTQGTATVVLGSPCMPLPSENKTDDPLIRFVDPSTTTADETPTKKTAVPPSDSEEPKYLDLLCKTVNAPNGSSISNHQIRTTLLRRRCRAEICKLKSDLEVEIPVLCQAIRANIIPNQNYEYEEKARSAPLEDVKNEDVKSQEDELAIEEKKEVLSSGKIVAPALPYICQWTPELRRHLFRVINLAATWVDAENLNREKYLTATERKSLSKDLVDYLKFSQQSTIVFKRILRDAFVPPYETTKCNDSDIATMRKFYSREKQRVEKAA